MKKFILYNLVFYMISLPNFIKSCDSKNYVGSVILQTKDISFIKKIIIQDTLVLFDIDHVILKQPYSYLLTAKNWFEKNCNAQEIKELIPKLKEFYNKHYELVDKGFTNLINELEKMNATIGALTSRANISSTLFNHLQFFKINFNLLQKENCELFINLTKKIILSNGIIFANFSNKGIALITILKQFNLLKKFKRIIFIDDQFANCEHVKIELTKENIESICIQYTALEDYYNPNIAQEELNKLRLNNYKI